MEIENYKISNGSITTPTGYRACGVRCGIKQQGNDLALLVSDVPAAIIDRRIFRLYKKWSYS